MRTSISFIIFFWVMNYIFQPQGEPHNCSCVDASDDQMYESMPSDTSFPDPRAIETLSGGNGPTVRIEYSLVGPAGKEKIVLLDTSDEGQHWVRSSIRTRETTHEKQFGSFVYRYDPEIGFQRSKDGGDHWERPQFRVNSEPLGVANGASNRRQPGVRFIFSAANPQRPTSIYGCLEIIGDEHNRGPAFLPGLYVSLDAGDNWSLLTEQIQSKRLTEGCPLGINPSNSNVMIAHGLKGVIVTRDGGKNWEAVEGYADLEKPARLKGYAENLAALKKRGLTADKEWPFDWTYLIVTQIEFLPRDPNIAFLVTNKGIYRTDDGAHSWCLLDTGRRKLFDVHSIYIDPMQKRRIFVGTSLELLVSDDLGCHFRTFFDWVQYSKNC